MSRQYFGTDGIRSKAGVFPLDAPTVYALGRAAGRVLGGGRARAILASDTRESCSWIAAALAAGLTESGAKCTNAGVLPTPALAHLCVRGRFTFGAMVSASHNPFDDNGIKFFSGRGYKLPDETEHHIEAALDGLLASGPVPPPASDLGAPERGLASVYVDWLASLWQGPDLRGVKVVLDCANGAAHAVAPALFERLGASVIRHACEPDGRNINDGCGSLHAGDLGRAVAKAGADFAFAFDGDADRCLAVTPSGRVLDGDYVLHGEAMRRMPLGKLPGRWVVGTVMSNLWLEKALTEAGARFFRAPVGDRYVLQCLQDRGGVLGGEPSGHVLFLDQSTTGDGLLTALAYARLARDAGGMEELAKGITPFPQVLANLRVAKRLPLEDQPAIVRALEDETASLADRGRIVLRYSGTEPLLRLMVEAETEEEVAGVIARLGEVLKAVLGEARTGD